MSMSFARWCHQPVATGWHRAKLNYRSQACSARGKLQCRASWFDDDVNSSSDVYTGGKTSRVGVGGSPWYEDNRDARPARGGRGRSQFERGRGGRGTSRPAPSSRQQPRQQDSHWTAGAAGYLTLRPIESFSAVINSLKAGHKEQQVIRRESWEKLLALISSAQQARQAFTLLQADAAVREATEWDWTTEGYGQIVLQLVAAATAVGEHGIAEQVVGHAKSLHLNTDSKEFVGALMRKMVGAGADSSAVLRMYELEKSLRGSNTHMAAHELSRVLRKEENVSGIRSLIEQASAGTVQMKPQLQDDLQAWLSKRGVLM